MTNFVSGPTNCVRIEGQMGNINKVLYVFFDVHVSLNYQTECVDIRATEFKDYLIKNFDLATKNNVDIDFFLETYTLFGVFSDYYTTKDTLKQKGIYIHKLRKFFKQIFNYDKHANKIHKSKEFPKTRLHYIDFRDLFIYDILFDKIPQIKNYFTNYPWNNMSIIEQDINYFRNEINYISQRLIFLKGYVFDGIEIKGKKTEAIRMFEKIINKILNVYENKNIKKVLKTYFLDNLKIYFDKFEKAEEKLLDQLIFLQKKIVDQKNKLNDKHWYGLNMENVVTEYLPNLWKVLNELFEIVEDISVFIIDIYFLRRFLDKKYISNSIVYTGGFHSCNYLFCLIKYFGFKITNSSYQKISSKDIATLCNKSDNYSVLKQIFFPPELYQCSDLTNFPESFL